MHLGGWPHKSETGDGESGAEGDRCREKGDRQAYGGTDTQHDSYIRRLCFHLVLVSRMYIILGSL